MYDLVWITAMHSSRLHAAPRNMCGQWSLRLPNEYKPRCGAATRKLNGSCTPSCRFATMDMRSAASSQSRAWRHFDARRRRRQHTLEHPCECAFTAISFIPCLSYPMHWLGQAHAANTSSFSATTKTTWAIMCTTAQKQTYIPSLSIRFCLFQKETVKYISMHEYTVCVWECQCAFAKSRAPVVLLLTLRQSKSSCFASCARLSFVQHTGANSCARRSNTKFYLLLSSVRSAHMPMHTVLHTLSGWIDSLGLPSYPSVNLLNYIECVRCCDGAHKHTACQSSYPFSFSMDMRKCRNEKKNTYSGSVVGVEHWRRFFFLFA